ncbi:MAG: ABC transporter ATP-binding protein/permease [Ruminococcus sp.]|nr:ABC transporter ATP-binding protein/permease [Ruminococcus sp.]MCM1480228.1 ABC transporter ATP-binding protein/permease [Muribaculaceae bacterium]
MLELNQIVKNYKVGDTEIHALKGVSMKFRENEFVSVLGQSGCGKTTLLNIIGGLDQYTSGDLIINGKSTKQYKDKDWDTYRNHSIGFVFQSYNLIPHQTVLSNVELALTLSGVSKSERRKRATEALEKVGLGDQLNKKPNQMSGGQMQRVAIARALVNEPDILLADEPTGALDSETSLQIMELLKEIAKDKLIIMVTHNPELAEKYSTRIIRLLDGEVKDDTMPYDGTPEPKAAEKEKPQVVKKKASMSFWTALSLSMNNLMTKKGRTFMTAFAGSIGIIGIALILSLSSGAQDYIDQVQEETLSSYPLTIEGTTVDTTTMMTTMMAMAQQNGEDFEEDKIYPQNVMTTMMEAMFAEISSNDLESFKVFLESGESDIQNLVSDIKYSYSTPLTVYKADTSDGVYRVNPISIYDTMGLSQMTQMTQMTNNPMLSTFSMWKELISKEEILNSQYEVLAGHMPENYNEVILLVNKYNQVTDYSLYSLGILDDSELADAVQRTMDGEEVEDINSTESISFDDILGLKFKLIINPDYYEEEDGVWVDKSGDEIFMTDRVNNAEEIEIVGIVRPSDNTAAANEIGSIGYKAELMTHLIEKVNDSEIVKQQKDNPDIDVFTGIEFPDPEEKEEEPPLTMEDIQAYIMTLDPEMQQTVMGQLAQAQEMGMSEEQIAAAFAEQLADPTTDATYDGNLSILGVSDITKPSSINIYPKDFESKELITDIIDDYNTRMDNSGRDEMCIQYSDIMGIMMSSVTTIIDAISYILIAFVAISLVVSSIMIGIITYISVLERTKEIGILRSIGASKRDISRVFNAETLIVGFTAGAIGILTTLLLTIPINMIITHLTDVHDLCHLPPVGGAVLVVISMVLTLIAGLIPSRVAAKKDPVTALRTE